MANFTIADIKALREQLGTGMVDTKKALEEADGDLEKAVEILRLKGAKGNAKRADRSTSEGLVTAVQHGDKVTILELNTETDFVAKNERFIALADKVLEAAAEIRERGPRTVLVTSLVTDQTDPETVQMLVVDDSGAHVVTTPRLEAYFTGSGDVTSALFLAHLLGTGSARSAVENTASSMFGLLRRTTELGRRELALVAAQDEFVSPTETFVAQRVG